MVMPHNMSIIAQNVKKSGLFLSGLVLALAEVWADDFWVCGKLN